MECGKWSIQSIRIVTMCPELSWGRRCLTWSLVGQVLQAWLKYPTETVLSFHPEFTLIRQQAGTSWKKESPRQRPQASWVMEEEATDRYIGMVGPRSGAHALWWGFPSTWAFGGVMNQSSSQVGYTECSSQNHHSQRYQGWGQTICLLLSISLWPNCEFTFKIVMIIIMMASI